MAVNVLSVAELSKYSISRVNAVELTTSSASTTAISSRESVSFGTPDGTGVDITSTVTFTVNNSVTVGAVKLIFDSTVDIEVLVVDFATTYPFPNGGTFDLDSCLVTVS